MKRFLTMAVAALLVTGAVYAGGKKGKKDKECSKTEACCSKEKTAEAKSGCCQKGADAKAKGDKGTKGTK